MQQFRAPVRRGRRRACLAAVGALSTVALGGCGAAPVAAPAPPAPVARFASYAETSPSWNRNVPCAATVTTLGNLLGSGSSSGGGPTFAGGGFKPGVPDRRDATPPCQVNGVPTLVELRRVKMGSCHKINRDGDWSCTLHDPSRPAGNHNRLHIETGRNVRAMGDWSVPPGGTLLDVQGFVFWDPSHTDAKWHGYTGWELHSFTAWRRSS